MSRKHVEDEVTDLLAEAKRYINSGEYILLMSTLARALGLAQALVLYRIRGEKTL